MKKGVNFKYILGSLALLFLVVFISLIMSNLKKLEDKILGLENDLKINERLIKVEEYIQLKEKDEE